MSIIYLFLAVLVVGSTGVASVALNRYDAKKESKKYSNYNIGVGVFSGIAFVSLLYFINLHTENKREHFKGGGYLVCSGRLDNYLVSNKEYILRDNYFIKEERVLSISHCSRIE